MTPIFDGKKAVERWQREGGYLSYSGEGGGELTMGMWWWSAKSNNILNTDTTRDAIIAAGYSEEEADKMMEGK